MAKVCNRNTLDEKRKGTSIFGAAACILRAEIMVIDGFFKLAMQAIFQRAKSLMLTIASSYSAASLRFGQYPTVRRINESVTLSSLGRLGVPVVSQHLWIIFCIPLE